MNAIINKENLRNLLDKTKLLLDKNEEIIRIRKEYFNIFSILRKDYDEDELHSRFLFELLSAEGSHHYGTKFLELFLETVLPGHSFSLEKVKVYREKQIETGRVDIYIKIPNDCGKEDVIILENKVYAGDQEGQLCRYFRHLETKGENSKLFYLTLFGNKASEKSRKCNNIEISEEDYERISYKKEIKEWLEKCMKETHDFPILHETIKQYYILIKKLTNQLIDNKMEKELRNLFIEHYREARTIADYIDRILLNEIREFFEDLKSRVENVLNRDLKEKEWEVKIVNDFTDKWGALFVRHIYWLSGIHIGIEAQKSVIYNVSVFGIRGPKKEIGEEKWKEFNAKINAELVNKYNLDKETVWWIKYQIIDEFFNKMSAQEKLFIPEKKEELLEYWTDKIVSLAKDTKDIFKLN